MQSLDHKITAGEALRKAGYSFNTSRTPGQFIRQSKGLREAICVLSDLLDRHPVIPPRYKKYQRRKSAKTAVDYCLNLRGASNESVKEYRKQELKAERIAAGIPPSSGRCPYGHKLEGADHWCPVCSRTYK